MVANRCAVIFRRVGLAAGMLLTPLGAVWGEGSGEDGRLVKYKLVHEEVGGGSDSAVSPDGRFVAFSTRRSGNMDVWTVEVETGKLRQITTNPAVDNEARWRPDGQYLCFVTQRHGSQDIYIINLETLEETPIATQPYNEDYPSYSQDGTEICFTGGPRGYREVQIYNFATGEIRTITRGFGYVGSTNFSPDGKWIVFHAYYDNSYLSGRSDVFVVPSHGGEPINLTQSPDIWDYKPNWSWDGEWITFSSKRGTPNFNIWVMRKDGSDLHALTNVVGPDLRWSNWLKDGRVGWHQINPQTGKLRAVSVASGKVEDLFESDFNVNDVALSPDGRKVLFETDAKVYVMEAKAGAEAKEIAQGLSPRWAGKDSVAYLSRRGTQVSVVNVESGETRSVEVKPAQWPAAQSTGWSPDGKTLALVTANEAGQALVLVDKNGATRTLVENADAKSAPVWTRDGKQLLFAENHLPSVGYYVSLEPVVKNNAVQAGR